MKCAQKSCQRTKNISAYGNWNVCQDVIKETSNNIHKKFPWKKVEVDFKDLLHIHEKLQKVKLWSIQ